MVVALLLEILQNLKQNLTEIKMMRCFLKHHWLTDYRYDKQACQLQ